MKRLLWVIMLFLVLLLSGCFDDPSPIRSPRPIAGYLAQLQTLGEPTAARGAASGVLFSDDELSVTGVYQGLSSNISSVRVIDEDARQLCTLDHSGGTEGTFGDICTLSDAQVNDLQAGRIRVFVYNAISAQELGGQFVFERSY